MLLSLHLFLAISYSQSIIDIPAEVVSHNIFGALPVVDKSHSILSLSKAGKHHFDTFHSSDIQLQHQLFLLIMDLKLTNSSFTTIRHTIQNLQFSEIFPLILPKILRTVSQYPQKERAFILDAMNIHSIGMSELKALNLTKSISSELARLLIFSSRALLNFYIPNIPLPLDQVTILEGIRLPGYPEIATEDSQSWFDENYPWIVHYFEKKVFSQHQYWAIYMSYLCEIVFDLGFKNMNIPKLNCVYKHDRMCDDSDLQKRRNLKDLMKHGLIVWSRDNINDLRSSFFKENKDAYPFFLFVLEAQRISRVLFYDRDQIFVYGFQLMTRFVLDLVDKYNVDLHVNVSNILEIKPLTRALSFIEAYRFGNHGVSDNESFERLTKLILRIGDITQNNMLLIGCLAQSEVDRGYINATFRMLIAHTPSIADINLKEFLIQMIIGRSKSQYYNVRNLEKSRAEIRKLAKDPLFEPETLIVLSEEIDSSYAYVMITELCRQRKDWPFEAALMKTPSRKIANVMMSMILFGEPE